MSPLGTFLNGGTATQLRGLPWLALSDTGQRGTLASTSDSGGGASQVWTFGASIPCRIDPFGSGTQNETPVASRLSDRSTHLITTPAGTTVTHNDRFAVSGRGTFEVTAVRTRTGELTHVFEAVEVS